MEYYNLRLEYKNNYLSSYYTDSLAIMISENCYLNRRIVSQIIKESISSSETPIKFLNNVKKSIQE